MCFRKQISNGMAKMKKNVLITFCEIVKNCKKETKETKHVKKK